MRGLCHDIYTDKSINFTDASQELKIIIKNITDSIKQNDELKHFLIKNKVIWHFIPPRNPHFGGLCEAAVESAKYHLIRILKCTHLTLNTYIQL